MASIISLSAGQALRQNYRRNSLYNIKVGTTVINAIAIDMDMLTAMNNLLSSHPDQGLAGFRVYVGLNSNNQKVGILVGLNADGTDATSLELYSTIWNNSGPCPPFCDMPSPIM